MNLFLTFGGSINRPGWRKKVSQSEGFGPQQNRHTGQNAKALSIMGLPNMNVEILLQ